MQKVLTGREKADKLITRAHQLKVLAETLRGRRTYLIERTAYSILEVYDSRPRAILRYIGYAFRQWRGSTSFSVQFGTRVWWYRRVKGLDHGKAIDLACVAIEEKVFSTMKGGA